MGRPRKNNEQLQENLDNPFLQEYDSEVLVSDEESMEDAFVLTPIDEAPKVGVNRIFKLLDLRRTNYVSIDGQDDIYDPVKKENRRARLLRGCDSIWMDDQKGYTKEYIDKNKMSLLFDKGVLVIPEHQVATIKFAEICNSNAGNSSRRGYKKVYFKEWNPAKMAEEAMNKELTEIKAVSLAKDAEMEQIIPHATYLGIKFKDQYGLTLPPNAIKTQYLLYAKRNPQRFIDSLNSPTTQIAYKVSQAINLKGLIDLGRDLGMAYWKDGGFITAIPSNQDPEEFLIHFAQLPNKSSVEFKNQLETLVK